MNLPKVKDILHIIRIEWLTLLRPNNSEWIVVMYIDNILLWLNYNFRVIPWFIEYFYNSIVCLSYIHIRFYIIGSFKYHLNFTISIGTFLTQYFIIFILHFQFVVNTFSNINSHSCIPYHNCKY